MNKRVRKRLEQFYEEVSPDVKKCVACEQPLGIPGGMAGTGLCGPCCTGEAASIEEFGETW